MAVNPANGTCRVLGVFGKAPAGLGIGNTAPRDAWSTLLAGTRVQTKAVRTGRELAFEGPARVIPCKMSAWGEEEAWAIGGTVTSSPGSGEAPGQEQWIVTRLGVVRYAAATAKVSAPEDGASMTVRVPQGAAWMVAADDARTDTDAEAGQDGWTRLGTGAVAETVTVAFKDAGPTPRARAETAVARCSEAAKASREVAAAIEGMEAGVPLGDLPVKDIVARRRARAFCAVAGVRVWGLPEAEGKALRSALTDAGTL